MNNIASEVEIAGEELDKAYYGFMRAQRKFLETRESILKGLLKEKYPQCDVVVNASEDLKTST